MTGVNDVCRVCGKPLKGLEGLMVEYMGGKSWKDVSVPLCKVHRAKAWRAVTSALWEAVKE